MQEVVRTAERNELDELLDGLGLYRTHQADVLRYTPPYAERYGGSVVASHWPHRLVEALDLRLADAGDVPWATFAVAVELPREGDVLFIGATAAWRLDAESTRERQAIMLTDLDPRHRRNLPTIIAGDLNSPPEAAGIRYLTGLRSLAGQSVYYHDAWHAHPNAHCRVRKATLAFDRAIDGIWASDHFGVVADLEIGKTA